MKTLILSDIHLGSKHCSHLLLREVLKSEPFDRLILNGDTLNSVNLKKLKSEHWHLVDILRKLGKQRELIVIRGNHDHEAEDDPQVNGHGFSTRNVLPALLEAPMIEDYQLQVGSGKYHLMHGDRFDPTLHYPVLTDVAGFCYQMTTKMNKKLAKWLKKKSKKWGGVLEYVRNKSLEFAKQNGFAGIITGHTHFAEDSHHEGIHYLNTGCWTEHPCTYLSASSTGITLHSMAE